MSRYFVYSVQFYIITDHPFLSPQYHVYLNLIVYIAGWDVFSGSHLRHKQLFTSISFISIAEQNSRPLLFAISMDFISLKHSIFSSTILLVTCQKITNKHWNFLLLTFLPRKWKYQPLASVLILGLKKYWFIMTMLEMALISKLLYLYTISIKNWIQ